MPPLQPPRSKAAALTVVLLVSMASDVELLEAWRRGDARSGRSLFERYFEPVSRFFANKLGHDHDDLVQETFTAFVGGQHRLREDANVRSYLFGIAYNVLKRHFRHKARPEQIEILESCSVCDLSAGPSTLMRTSEQEQALVESLRALPLELQVILEMHYWEGMPSHEIGEALGLASATIRNRMRRGRALLEEQLMARLGRPNTPIGDPDLEQWVSQVRAGLGAGLPQ